MPNRRVHESPFCPQLARLYAVRCSVVCRSARLCGGSPMISAKCGEHRYKYLLSDMPTFDNHVVCNINNTVIDNITKPCSVTINKLAKFPPYKQNESCARAGNPRKSKFMYSVNHDKVYTLRPRQNGRHFSEDIFSWIFVNEIVWLLIKIPLKFVPMTSINTIPALIQIMAWHRPGGKPLSEPMMVNLLTHICVTRPQWANSCLSCAALWHKKS